MKKLVLAVAVLALAVPFASAQREENLPTEIRTVEAGTVRVRYLNFSWNETGFKALEDGSGQAPGDRSWALARIFTPEPLKVDGRPVTGGSLLILHPARGDQPMAFEIRVIDMRDVFTNVNFVAEAPDGKTIWTGPAVFETVDAVADRLTIDLKKTDDKYTMAVHYGNRRAVIEADE